MKVDVKWGATIHHVGGRPLYEEWPGGHLTRDGKRISKAEAKRLVAEAIKERREHERREQS